MSSDSAQTLECARFGFGLVSLLLNVLACAVYSSFPENRLVPQVTLLRATINRTSRSRKIGPSGCPPMTKRELFLNT